jgi:hypothetical protein
MARTQTQKERRPTRDRVRRLLVGVTAEERRAIEASAQAVGLPVSAYLRAAGLCQPLVRLADRAVLDLLIHLHGELGHLRQRLADESPEVLATRLATVAERMAAALESLA